MPLRDRKILVLGGTGGIGEALVAQLIDAGVRVIAAGRDANKWQRTLAKHPTWQGKVDWVSMDLASANLAAQARAALLEHPDLSGLVHCAGINRFAAATALSDADIDQLLFTNLRSAMVLVRELLPMIQRTSGLLAFVGSTLGSIGLPGYTAYSATKFGLRGYTEALRRELADSMVSVVYVAPRATRTAMNSADVMTMNEALGNASDTPEQVASDIMRAIVAGRQTTYLGWPEKFFVRLNSVLPRLVDGALAKQLPTIKKFLKT